MAVWLAVSLIMALVILAAPWRWALGAFLFWTPFSGTAVAIIGGDPILVPLIVCVALTLRYAFSLFDRSFREEALILLSREGWLVAFLAYAVVSGLLFPRLFAGETSSFTNINGRFVLLPLGPGHMSIAQIGYLTLAVTSFFAVRHVVFRVGPAAAVLALLAQVVFIGGLGFLQATLGLVGVSVPVEWVVTNEAATLLLNIVEGGFARVTGVFTEASAYAAWGVGAFGMMVFLYLNRIMPQTNLVLSAILGLTLVLSTSSTAYGGLAVLVLAFAFVVAFDADPRRKERGMMLLGLGAAVGIGLIVMIVIAESGPLYRLRLLLDSAIFGKQYSMSALERGAWADAAFQSGLDTYLLGAGYGAVRSSGVGQMLFGAVGVIGTALFVLFLAPKLLLALRPCRSPEAAVAAAAALALAPAFGVLLVSSSDLGLWNVFWYYAAIAIGSWERSVVMSAKEAAAQRPFDDGDVRDWPAHARGEASPTSNAWPR